MQVTPDTYVLDKATLQPKETVIGAKGIMIVSDIGGVLAHGSIVARAHGIPAVMGVDGASRRIVSGQLLTVDGNTGTVTLGEKV